MTVKDDFSELNIEINIKEINDNGTGNHSTTDDSSNPASSTQIRQIQKADASEEIS